MTLSTSTLLIGYYHGILMGEIDADKLVTLMASKELLSVYDNKLISAGCNIYQRNWMLLESVRSMKAPALVTFCEIVMEIWPIIGTQLMTGMHT